MSELREAITTALDAATTPASTPDTPAPAPTPSAPAPEAKVETPAKADSSPVAPAKPDEATPTPPPTGKAPSGPEKPIDGDSAPAATPSEPSPETETALKAPQSWKPTAKAVWATLPLEARQEVARREREISRTVAEVASAKQFATQMQEVIRPFEARIATVGVQPHQAVQELLKADYILASAPAPQRAAFMAKLIADYGIDIALLDQALAGNPQAINPVQRTVQELLQQQLAPIQQILTQQAQEAQKAREAQNQTLVQEIETMESDPKYPYFSMVREDMADIIEMSAKRGLYLSLGEAYNRAVKLNPDAEKAVQAQQAKEQAAQATAKAQQALRASASVSGSPTGPSASTAPPTDLRSAIEAAMEAQLR